MEENSEFIPDGKILEYFLKYKEKLNFLEDTLNQIDKNLRSIIVVPPGSKCPPGYRPDGKGKCRKPL